MRRGWLAWLALTLAVPARGQAAPMGHGVEPVAVLSLVSDLDDDVASKGLTNALRQQVLDAPEYALWGQSPMLIATAHDVRCQLDGPGGLLPDERAFDEACLRKMGKSIGVTRFLWGMVTATSGRPMVRMHFWQQGRGDRAVALPYEPAARERLAERLYRQLVTPEKVGDLTVTGAFEGELVVDGKAAGPFAPGVELTLLGGEHLIEVRKGLRVVARGRALVEARGRTEVRLEAVAAPPPPGAPPGGGRSELPMEVRHGDWKRTAGFVGLGLGVALIGAGVVSSVRVKGLGDDLDAERAFVEYRSGVAGHEDSCDAADANAGSTRAGAATAARVRRVCSGVTTLEVAQLVFYGLSALAVGAGAYLLATSSAPPKPAAWSIHPWAGVSGGGLRLGLTF